MTEIDWYAVIQKGFAAAEARKNEGLPKNVGNRGNRGNNFVVESVAPRDLAGATGATDPAFVAPVAPSFLKGATSSAARKHLENQEVTETVAPVAPVAPHFSQPGKILRARYRRILDAGPLLDKRAIRKPTKEPAR